MRSLEQGDRVFIESNGRARSLSRQKCRKYSIIFGNVGIAAPETPPAVAYVSGVLTGVKLAPIRRFPERTTKIEVEQGLR